MDTWISWKKKQAFSTFMCSPCNKKVVPFPHWAIATWVLKSTEQTFNKPSIPIIATIIATFDHLVHRCELSRNVRDSPEIGGPVPCPARKLIAFWLKCPGVST